MGLEVPSPPEAAPLAAAAARHGGRVFSLALLLVSVSFAVAGQFMLKAAMNEIGRVGQAQLRSPGRLVAKAVAEPRLWIGLALFGISALFWLVVLSRVALSVAYPLVGFSYIIVVAIAKFRLNEAVPPLRWIGVCVIATGIALIGLSFRRASGT